MATEESLLPQSAEPELSTDESLQAQCETEGDIEFIEEITEEEVEAELQRLSGNGHSDSEHIAVAQEDASETMNEDATLLVLERSRPPRPVCSSCGAYVRALDKFCIHCGDRQPQRIPSQMKPCSECRTQLPLTANFCFVCGTEAGSHARKKVKAASDLFCEDDPELFPRFEA